MQTIIDIDHASARYRTALRGATEVVVSRDFDDLVIAGANRPKDWIELLTTQLQVLAPALVCGACLALSIVHVAFNSALPEIQSPLRGGISGTINLSLLMREIDDKNNVLATDLIFKQSVADNARLRLTPIKDEQRYALRSYTDSAARLI